MVGKLNSVGAFAKPVAEGMATTAATGAIAQTGLWQSFLALGPVQTVTAAVSSAFAISSAWISTAVIPAIQAGSSAVMAFLGPYGVAAVAAVAALGTLAWWKSGGSPEPQAPAMDARQRAKDLALARQQSIHGVGATNNVSTGHGEALERQRAMQQSAGAQV